jgi:hypothetical protein
MGSRPDDWGLDRRRTWKNIPATRGALTRRVAKFYISCCRAAAARCFKRSAKRLRIGRGEDADVADLPRRRGARPISVGD